MDGRTERWTDERRDIQTDRRWIDECNFRQTDGWTNGEMDGGIPEWTDRQTMKY